MKRYRAGINEVALTSSFCNMLITNEVAWTESQLFTQQYRSQILFLEVLNSGQNMNCKRKGAVKI